MLLLLYCIVTDSSREGCFLWFTDYAINHADMTLLNLFIVATPSLLTTLLIILVIALVLMMIHAGGGAIEFLFQGTANLPQVDPTVHSLIDQQSIPMLQRLIPDLDFFYIGWWETTSCSSLLLLLFISGYEGQFLFDSLFIELL